MNLVLFPVVKYFAGTLTAFQTLESSPICKQKSGPNARQFGSDFTASSQRLWNSIEVQHIQLPTWAFTQKPENHGESPLETFGFVYISKSFEIIRRSSRASQIVQMGSASSADTHLRNISLNYEASLECSHWNSVNSEIGRLNVLKRFLF